MYCKAGVACTNPEVYGDIKRGRRLAPSKGITCQRCQGKCCNDACLEKHKCKQRARPSPSVHQQGVRLGHPRWQLDPNSYELKPYDASGGQVGLSDPMALAALNGLRGQGGLILGPQAQQYPGGIMLGTGPDGNMMPIMSVLPLPLMFNPAALQQGAEGNAELQAALAAMQQASAAMGTSAPMMLMPNQEGGTPTAAQAAAISASQALQFAQLQGLAGNGQLPTLLQLTVQPDGSGGLMQANGQRLQLPGGMGMPLQLPGGLQILSAEGLQLTTDSNGNMQMMQVMPHDATGGMGADQATIDAAVAAAAAAAGAGQAGLPLMAGLTAMGANLLDSSGLAAAEAGTGEAVMMDHPGAAVDAVAASAAAAEAVAAHQGAVEAAALQNALEAAAGTCGMGQEAVPAEAPPTSQAESQALADATAAVNAAAAAAAASGAPTELPNLDAAVAAAAANASASTLPAIAPLNMSPAIAEVVKAVASGRMHNAEEDAAAAALMSLATDKKKAAALAAQAAQAAVTAANAGIISQAAAQQAIEEARRLAAEAEAEEQQGAAAEAKAGQAQLEQQQLEQQHLEQQQQFAQQQLEQQALQLQQFEQQQLEQQQLEQLQQQQQAQLEAQAMPQEPQQQPPEVQEPKPEPEN